MTEKGRDKERNEGQQRQPDKTMKRKFERNSYAKREREREREREGGGGTRRGKL